MSRPRRGFERADRLSELLREILADELTRIDDGRLAFVTITGVDVDRDLATADVYFSTVDLNPEAEVAVGRVLGRYRSRLQRAIGDQAHVRRVPGLRFHPDAGMHAGARVEEILRSLRQEPSPSQPPHSADPPEEPPARRPPHSAGPPEEPSARRPPHSADPPEEPPAPRPPAFAEPPAPDPPSP